MHRAATKLSSDRLRFVAIAKAKKNYSSGQNGNRYSKLLPTAGGLTVIRNQHDMTTLIEQSQPAPVYGAGWTTSSDWFMSRIRPAAYHP